MSRQFDGFFTYTDRFMNPFLMRPSTFFFQKNWLIYLVSEVVKEATLLDDISRLNYGKIHLAWEIFDDALESEHRIHMGSKVIQVTIQGYRMSPKNTSHGSHMSQIIARQLSPKMQKHCTFSACTLHMLFFVENEILRPDMLSLDWLNTTELDYRGSACTLHDLVPFQLQGPFLPTRRSLSVGVCRGWRKNLQT